MVALDRYDAEVVLDSVAPNGARLTTMAVTYPRFVHSELMTHRQFSRNAASSRAIPVAKRMRMVQDHPVYPVEWGANQKGMQAGEILSPEVVELAEAAWNYAREACLIAANDLDRLNVHKQLANRVIECWSWITVLFSATEWSNFFALRCDANAQPEAQKSAYLMRDIYIPNIDEPSPEFIKTAHLMQSAWERSRPSYLDANEWHLPYINDQDRKAFDVPDLCRLSAARCARISYLTFEGRREPEKDFTLHDGLTDNGHWSPLEHLAQALDKHVDYFIGNFCGFRQYRKMFPNECR